MASSSSTTRPRYPPAFTGDHQTSNLSISSTDSNQSSASSDSATTNPPMSSPTAQPGAYFHSINSQSHHRNNSSTVNYTADHSASGPALLAEAAKRAQIAVLERDLKAMELDASKW